MRNPWAILAGAATVAVLVGASWWLAGLATDPADRAPAAGAVTEAGGPTSPSPAGTGSGTGPPSPTGGVPGTATAAPDETTPAPASPEVGTAPPTVAEVAPPTPSPATAPADGPPLRGTARRTDPAGDLADSAGRPPPEPQPAADLTAVELSGDGEELLVAFSLAGDVPARASSLVWSLDVWVGGDLAYTATVQQIAGSVVAGVFDWAAGEQARLPEPPTTSGSTVAMRLPRALLDRVDGPFQWQAMTQLDGAYEDHVPADGVLTWFPDAGS